MNERILSHGVVFEAREGVTIFGNSDKGNVAVLPMRGTKISNRDVDRALELTFGISAERELIYQDNLVFNNLEELNDLQMIS